MKQFSLLQRQILESLSDGQCHSGSQLGERLAVSRTAVWKQIRQLTELGLPIICVPQHGYKFSYSFVPLDESKIRHKLMLEQPLYFHLFAEIDSTNFYLKNLEPQPGLSICCAEKQTKGRGRFGREWLSPFGENIYLSSRWEFDCCLSKLSGLSLVVSLAVLNSLEKNNLHHDIRVKWPNDLMWSNKKLCGILIEINAESNNAAQVIIGIGLNVNMLRQSLDLFDKPWCSLQQIYQRYFDRNALIADLLSSLACYLALFKKNELTHFVQEWQKVDALWGQFITVTQPQGCISGIAQGINEYGQLCLLDNENKLHYLSSGEASLKK